MKTFLRNERVLGTLISFLVHVALLSFGGLAFATSVEYAVESGDSGVEVSLIAAPAEPEVGNPQVEMEEAPIEEIKPEPQPEAIPLPEEVKVEQKVVEQVEVKEEKKVLTSPDSPVHGDGSSPTPGQSSTTFYSAGGAITEAKPNYLRNPAPAYPYEARQNGWEGTVVLKVLVDKSGQPIAIEKQQGSGYSVLDESALKTVRKWKFRPAQIGSLAIESSVIVPIRFELQSLR